MKTSQTIEHEQLYDLIIDNQEKKGVVLTSDQYSTNVKVLVCGDGFTKVNRSQVHPLGYFDQRRERRERFLRAKGPPQS
jgi:hypothetical protein